MNTSAGITLEPRKQPAGKPQPDLVGHRMTESIRELILTGEFPPGSKISQESLANRFGASRIPVREALSRLESDGLVVLKANRGAWVAKLDLKECLEIYKIRERVEPLALSEAVARISEAEIDRLEELVLAMESATETEVFLRLDREFHLASYRAADMQQLAGMVERFWNTTQHYRRAFTELLGSEGSWIIHAEHKLIIDALRRRDSVGAAHLLHEHIRRTRFELERHQELFSAPAQGAAPRRR
jgi:DNA-binding GntR family transcriptional regulator